MCLMWVATVAAYKACLCCAHSSGSEELVSSALFSWQHMVRIRGRVFQACHTSIGGEDNMMADGHSVHLCQWLLQRSSSASFLTRHWCLIDVGGHLAGELAG